MTRFLVELLSSGQPPDVCAAAADLITDELRHVELCAAVCRALGVEPQLPEPLELIDPPGFLSRPMHVRAHATALTMLVINETISTTLIEDLVARCPEPAIRQVLVATSSDEDTHRDLGWAFLDRLLESSSKSQRAALPELVQLTLAPHERACLLALEKISPECRRLDSFKEPHMARLGLLSMERQALLYQQARDERLAPGLRARKLWPG
jgi:hypothetical protein